MLEHLRFLSKVNVTDTCWLWIGGLNHDGYGRFYKSTVAGKQPPHTLAHRYSIVLFGGYLPKGLVCDHECRNRRCVNPSHIRLVTQSVNVMENSNSLQAQNAKKTHCPKGHPYSEENTYIRKLGWRKCKTCTLTDMKERYARPTKTRGGN